MALAIATDGTPAPDTTLHSPDFLESCIREALSTITKSTLEPALTISDIPSDAFDRLTPPTVPPDDIYRTALETAHKSLLYTIASESDPDDTDGSVVAFANLLDFALICTEQELADASMPFTLLEEVFDTQTIPSAERLFRYLESRVERLTAGMEGGKGKALVLLRLCNELLRRLSKAEDTIFCGRILIFLSKSFPIHERSAVNLRGEFNVENITIFDDVPEPSAEDVESMDIDDIPDLVGMAGKMPTPTEKKQKPDEAEVALNQLYRTFWSLQPDFSDPARLFVPENFARFKTGLEATLARFRIADEAGQATSGASKPGQSKRNEDRKPTSSHANSGEKRSRDDGDAQMLGESFNPKYLTGRELFELEISDLTFRRHVLVQAMILLDFLLSLTPAAKEKWTQLKNPNRSVQFAFTLSPEDETWVRKTFDDITASLTTDIPSRLFNRLITTVLSREQNWLSWKLEGCQPFDLPPLPPSTLEETRKLLVNATKPDPKYRFVMGTPALSHLWSQTNTRILNNSDDPDAPQSKKAKYYNRIKIPTLDEFSSQIDSELIDVQAPMFPSDLEPAKEKMMASHWKALRLVARDGVCLFNRLEDRKEGEEERNEIKMLLEVEKKAREELKARTAAAAAAAAATTNASQTAAKPVAATPAPTTTTTTAAAESETIKTESDNDPAKAEPANPPSTSESEVKKEVSDAPSTSPPAATTATPPDEASNPATTSSDQSQNHPQPPPEAMDMSELRPIESAVP